ncbi:hypothetical protein [Rhodococcus sp. BS-15]|uniref:hypothetical protein n=1 Tax=Rhodococcus sp. BS-15 TaxID=1304954 RepID=UPI000FFBD78A|nr:hypothetical protein [Rhodococcus sp. BS-15]
MVDIAIVFTAYCVMFSVAVWAVMVPSFGRAIASAVTPIDALCWLAIVGYLAAGSNNDDAMRAFAGVAVLTLALAATTGGVTRTRRKSAGTGKAVPL